MNSNVILQIVADGSPGGGTTAVLGLCCDLIKFGYNIALITQPNSHAFNKAKKMGLCVYELDFFTSRFDLTIPQMLKKLINAIKPVLIHVHGGRAAYPFCSSNLYKLPCPIVYTVHGYHFLKKSYIMRFLCYLSEIRISKRMEHTIFVSNNDLKISKKLRIQQKYNQTSVIYNGIDPKEINLNAKFNLNYDLVFLGRLCKQKNPFFILDIVNEVKKNYPYITIVIAGGGIYEDNLKKKARKLKMLSNIKFAGTVDREIAIKYLLSSKIFLFPSLWEGLPIALIEAMHCGLPVVASKIGGTDEVVVNNVNGFLISDFNPKKYATAIVNLLKNINLYNEFSSKGRNRVEEIFLRKFNSAKHRELYEQLIGCN